MRFNTAGMPPCSRRRGRKVERNVSLYNLDVVISVGYRVKSHVGTEFRKWATQKLREYLIRGYVINEKRLEQWRQEVDK